MFRRFGLRTCLPTLQVCLYIALISVGLPEQKELERKWAEWAPQWDGPYSAPLSWALGINFPAILLALAMLVPLAPVAMLSQRIVFEWFSLIIIGFAVALWWYWIGYRLDQAFGFLPRRPCTSTAGSKRLVIGLCMLGVCSFTLYWFSREQYMIEFRLPMVVWVVCGIWALCRRLRWAALR